MTYEKTRNARMNIDELLTLIEDLDLALFKKQREFLNEAIIYLKKSKPLTAEVLEGLQNFLDSFYDIIDPII